MTDRRKDGFDGSTGEEAIEKSNHYQKNKNICNPERQIVGYISEGLKQP